MPNVLLYEWFVVDPKWCINSGDIYAVGAYSCGRIVLISALATLFWLFWQAFCGAFDKWSFPTILVCCKKLFGLQMHERNEICSCGECVTNIFLVQHLINVLPNNSCLLQNAFWFTYAWKNENYIKGEFTKYFTLQTFDKCSIKQFLFMAKHFLVYRCMKEINF